MADVSIIQGFYLPDLIGTLLDALTDLEDTVAFKPYRNGYIVGDYLEQYANTSHDSVAVIPVSGIVPSVDPVGLARTLHQELSTNEVNYKKYMKPEHLEIFICIE